VVDGPDPRERRRTRTPGRIVKGRSALRLCCAGCGKYLRTGCVNAAQAAYHLGRGDLRTTL
jgi:hypothetical protein